MKKWFLKAFFLLSATMLLTTGLFELYSKMPVCEERENGRGAMNNSCLPYDQVLAGDYRVRKGQVYWEDREYAPEKNCGFGVYSILANITSFKCLLEMKGYIRTVEHRTLTKLEKLSPAFRVLEGTESGLLDWQKKQFNKYAVGEQGVYFEGRLLEGADPKNFSVIFPLGDSEVWSFFNVSRAGSLTFVSGKSLGNVDPALYHLLPPVKGTSVPAGCGANTLAEPLQAEDGSSFNGVANCGLAVSHSLNVLAPCEMSEKGVRGACWSLKKISDSAIDKGVAAQSGKDVFYFHRYGVSKFIGAALTDYFVFERNGMLYMNSGGTNFRMLLGRSNFATLILSRK